MQYDPIKTRLGTFFNKTAGRRKIFYRLLDLLLLRSWHIHKELRKFAKQQTNKIHVLDAGTGFGQYIYYMFRRFASWTIHGVDINPNQLKDTEQFLTRLDHHQRLSFAQADLEKFTDDEKYNLILCVDVMEHIPDDNRVFNNFYRVLQPGGMVLISTPSDQGGSDVHEEGEKSFIEEHVRDGYNINGIRQQLENAGFTRTEARYSYGKPGHISWLLSMKYPIQMINRSSAFFLLIPFYYLVTYPFAWILNLADLWSNHARGTGLIVKAWK